MSQHDDSGKIIDRDAIGKAPEPVTPWTVARVPSLRRQGASYDVERSHDGAPLTCSCPAFSFSRATPRTCKHIRIVEAAWSARKRCLLAKHRQGLGICFQCLVALLAAASRKVARDYRPKHKRSK